MENTWLWTDVSSLYSSVSTTPAWWKLWYDVFSVNEEEQKYADNKSRDNLLNYFTKRSSLRKALRSWEQTSWDRQKDNQSANISVLADGIINVMVNKWKDEKYMMDNYGSSNWNINLINKVKKLEWGKYANDIDAFIQWDWSNLTGTLSRIFPETIANMQEKEYKKTDYSEKNWWWRFAENFMWYMPKVAEWVNDIWNIVKTKTGKTDERSVQFWNYLYEKYWKNVKNVPEDLLSRDYKDFMALPEEKKNEYKPTLLWAWIKELEWLTDVMITATPWWAAIKWLLSATWATPWVNLINQWLWLWIWWLGRLINFIPWLSNIRDELPSEKDKQEWDAFMWWLWLAKWIKWAKYAKNLKAWDFSSAFETYKTSWIKAAIKELNAKAWWNSIEQLNQQKSELAQRITQAEEATAKATEQWLDIVNKSKDISKIKNIDELSQAIDDEIKAQKWSQTEVAAWSEDITLTANDLLDTRPAETIKWWKQSMATTPIQNVLDTMIEYYKWVDPRQAAKYRSYKTAIENWTIKLSDLLELRREANSWGQKYFDRSNMQLDTKAADTFASNMDWFNYILENIKWGKDIRATDTKLSNLYTLREAINDIKKSAYKEKWKASKQSALWKVLWRMASWLMFWAWDVLKRIYASFMQQVFKVEPKSMSNLEIANEIPNFLKDYKSTVSKLERAKNLQEATDAYNTFATQRWLDSWENFQTAVKEQASKTPKWILLWKYGSDARDNIDEFINGNK